MKKSKFKLGVKIGYDTKSSNVDIGVVFDYESERNDEQKQSIDQSNRQSLEYDDN